MMGAMIRVSSGLVVLALALAPAALPASRTGADGRLVGADISSYTQCDASGAKYSVDGVPMDLLEILRAHGFGLIRLRLWHAPAGGACGLDSTAALAARVKAAGFELMLDIHYSDTWADPAHQVRPAAWRGLAFSALVDSVYAYSNAVVRRFRDEGALPDYVQIGNEISSGMLWDDGRVGGAWDTPRQWSQLGRLLSAGAAGVRDSLPPETRPEVVIHVDNGADNGLCRWFFDHVVAQDVDFDVIGVSFYPWWHGTVSELGANLNDLADRYGKTVMVVETAYPWTLTSCDDRHNIVGAPWQFDDGYPASPEGQGAFLADVLAVVEGVPGGAGVVYWEPGWVCVGGGPGTPWENLALFDFNANALPGLAFAVPAEAPAGSRPR